MTAYRPGDRVTVRNGDATWPGTVEDVRHAFWGAVYAVALDCGGSVDVPERMLDLATDLEYTCSGELPSVATGASE